MLGISQVRTDLSTALAGGFSLDESIPMNTFRVFSRGSPISVGPQFLPLNYPSARDSFASIHETLSVQNQGVAVVRPMHANAIWPLAVLIASSCLSSLVRGRDD